MDSCVLGLEGRGRGRHAHEVEHDAASKMRYAQAGLIFSPVGSRPLCTHGINLGVKKRTSLRYAKFHMVGPHAVTQYHGPRLRSRVGIDNDWPS